MTVMQTLTAQGEVSVDHVDRSLPSVPVGPGAEQFTRAAKCQDIDQTAHEDKRPIHDWSGNGDCLLLPNYRNWYSHELTLIQRNTTLMIVEFRRFSYK